MKKYDPVSELGHIDAQIAECEMEKVRCPKCGKPMQKWFIIGGRERWECSCGYKEEVK